MTDSELIRKLNSVGKKAFVENFYLFKSYSERDISKKSCMEELKNKKVSEGDGGAGRRCSNAILIFRAKAECRALIEVISSKKLSGDTIEQAKKIYSDYRC